MIQLDATINQLQPSQEIEISRTETAYCTAERSGDGKTLRFIRYTENGKTWRVFKQSRL
ncbi:hypothetical protein IC229_05985 [Spirosoma sp. BT702]|uniref:Uncharacterized protein n=1 Tax=Spirosoma profusum TaxID=2771354 RepID=A0A926Y1L1_9BACT|nr:hypothetical protein [Spirosoma profusum]MBD2700176.1 hypothetical protein [Spirosoma profusum]